MDIQEGTRTCRLRVNHLRVRMLRISHLDRCDEDMEETQITAPIIALANLLPGALLTFFHNPIGTCIASPRSKLKLDEIGSRRLYEERTSQICILVLGIWLMIFGMIAFFFFQKFFAPIP